MNEFETLIYRKNKDWADKDVFIDLNMWEDFLDAMSKTRLQDEYNKAIRECDIFVMLFSTKVGQYTEEEFEAAFGQFKATNKPLIFTYFKDAPISTSSANKRNLISLWAFQEKLHSLGHFYTCYKNIDELKFHFSQQLDKLAAKDKLAANGFMGKWVAVIVGSIIIGVVSWWLTQGLPNPPSSPMAPSHTSPEPRRWIALSKIECNREGGLSSPSLPSAPPKGCVLIAEWWYPRNPTSCGIWIAATAVPFSHGVEGHWWYVPPERVSQHIAEYKSKPNSVNCEVKDFR